MDGVTIVEVRDGQGVTTARMKLAGPEITIGRNHDNLVVVDDEYVDAAHVRASLSANRQTLLVRDLGTTNGTRVDGNLLRDAEVEVSLGTPIQVGRTTIVVLSPDSVVEKAKRLPDSHDRALPYESIPAWIALGLAVAYFTTSTFLVSYDAMGGGELVGVGLFMVGMLLTWAGLWAAGSRLFTGAAHFREHLAFVSLLVLIIMPLSSFLGWVTFALGDPVSDAIINWGLLGVGVTTFTFFGHLDIPGRRSRRFKGRLAFGLAAGFVGLGLLLNRIDFGPPGEVAQSLGQISPVPTGLTRSGSLDDFLGGLGDLEAAVKEEAEEADRP